MDKPEIAHPRNVAAALARLAQELESKFSVNDQARPSAGPIRDVSGSIVGRWEIAP